MNDPRHPGPGSREVGRMHPGLARLKPHDVTLTPELWQAAAALAGLRVAVNDPVRQRNRDSGPRGNVLNDLIGAIAELVALRVLHDAGATGLTHSLIDLHSSVDELDFQGELGASKFRLEVKGHFHDPVKRYFLINEKAQVNSRRRNAHGHLPIVTQRLHSAARVGRMIWIHEVEQPPWQPARPFGHDRYDPAFPLPLRDLATIYLGGDLLAQGSRHLSTTDRDLLVAARRARQSLPSLRASGLTLDNMPITEIVHALNQVVRSG